MTIIIITGGTVDTDFASSFIKQMDNQSGADMFIAVDGGLGHADKLGIRPDILVGDFDSADPEVLSRYIDAPDIEVRRFNPVKDYTDTDLAIRTAIEKGANCIYILGASGTRTDHMLGSIHCLKQALDAGVRCYLVDTNNRIHLMGGIKPQPVPYIEVLYRDNQWGKYVSLIALTNEVSHVNLSGFAYNMTDGTFCVGQSLGISNEIVDDAATISLEQGILIVAESRD